MQLPLLVFEEYVDLFRKKVSNLDKVSTTKHPKPTFLQKGT